MDEWIIKDMERSKRLELLHLRTDAINNLRGALCPSNTVLPARAPGFSRHLFLASGERGGCWRPTFPLLLSCVLFFRLRRRGRPAKEPRRQVDGHREDDGRVVLGRDAVQRLQVAELQRRRR